MKKTLFLAGFLLPAMFADGQGVAIGDHDFTPNAAAILDVSARNKGVLVPRMTYTERMYIQTNAQSMGLLVFQTDRDAGFYYWDGLAWKFLSPQQASELPNLAAVATSGDYNDLINKPTISIGDGGGGTIVLSAVATTGNYADLLGKPRLRDLEQDELYYTTVSRAERDLWNGKANIADIPTRLRDLEQDEYYFTTVTRAEREMWNAKSNFSGNYSDLTNKPSISFVDGDGGTLTLAAVATTGNYEDLTNKPRLRDLEQDEYYFTTVSKAERDGWNAKSTFSGDYNDLQNKPTSLTFAPVATSGDYGDLLGKPRLQDLQQDENYYTTVTRAEREAWNGKSNFSGSYADLTNKPDIPSHLSHLSQDVNYQTVTAEEKYNWNHKATEQDLRDLRAEIPTALIQLTSESNSRLVTDTEKATWNMASSNASTSVAKTHLSDFTDDGSHRLVTDADKTNWNGKVNSDDMRLTDDRVPKGNAGGDLSGAYPNPTIKENVNLSGTPTANGVTLSINNLQAFIQNLSNGSTIVNVQTLVNAITKLEQVLLPTGTVIMWVGAVSQVPCGWQIMAELRDKFPIGAGLNYEVGSTGGEAAHTLTISEMPSHNHSALYGRGVRHGDSGTSYNPISGISAGAGTDAGETRYTGGGAAHNNLPPYYGLYFIEKVSLCLQ